MIDLFSVFTKGGIVLWQKSFSSVSDNVVNSLISDVFIQNKGEGQTFQKDNYTVKYTTANDLGLVFVSVYQSILRLSYIDELLASIKTIFVSLFADVLRRNTTQGLAIQTDLEFDKFSSYFDLRLEELESQFNAKVQGYRGDHETEPANEKKEIDIGPVVDEPLADSVGSLDSPEIPGSPSRFGSNAAITAAGGGRRHRRRAGRSKHSSPFDSPNASGAEDKAKGVKKTKKKRIWGDDGAVQDDDDDIVLDYSAAGDSSLGNDANISNTEAVQIDMEHYGSSKNGNFIVKDLSDELNSMLSEKKDAGDSTKGPAAFGFLRNFIGGKTLTPEDLVKALDAMQDHLMKKNVASEVAKHLCDVVSKSLIGSKTQSWTSVESTVREAMTEALRRILTPNSSLDLLNEVKSKQKTGSPYVISVVGVNGVGKSTNLSKLGFWLLQNKMKVLIVAGDTFRSGAVEQLKVHVKRLQDLTSRLGTGEVQIFDEGYGKDAAVISQKAIGYAKANGFDVVLIDTAGRRHNDERLMSSLERFGKLANPDKIIMVGEALVGTDSVQQARNFNAAFGPDRNLDFFLISKCDTVGDMIGSMVNMTYSTGIPVLFVGIGQHYTDLRTLSVDWAVNLLMT